MSFAAVVQLCSDFSLAPKLISLHTLRKIYERLGGLQMGSERPQRLRKRAFFGRFPLSSGLKWHQSKWTPGPWRPLTWIWMTSLGGSGMFVTEAGGGKARGRDSTGPGPLRKAQFMAFSELLVLFWVAFGPFLAAGELFEAFLFEVSVWRRRRR